MKKDQKPYLVAPCICCKQYFYVNLTKGQKIKKCLRCGKRNSVLKSRGEVVKGMTAALERVKERQHQFSLQQEGRDPDYHVGSEDGFVVASARPDPEDVIQGNKAGRKNEAEDNFEAEFEALLRHVSQEYDAFPEYVLGMKADEFHVPRDELKVLIQSYLRRGILSKNHDYLTLNNQGGN